MADRKIASDSLNHIFWIARIWRGIQLLLFSYGLLSININKESHVRPTVRSSRPSQGLSERRSKVLASDTRQCNPSTSRQQKAEGEENQSFAGHVVRQRETQLSLQSYVNSPATIDAIFPQAPAFNTTWRYIATPSTQSYQKFGNCKSKRTLYFII
jgi:hypothetical protein